MRSSLILALALGALAASHAAAQAPSPEIDSIMRQALGAQAPAAASTAPLRGRVVSLRTATLASRIAARVTKLDLRPGMDVKRGDVLFELDCAVERALRRRASAKLDAAEAKVAVNERLLDLQSVGRLEVDLARAEVAEARADASVLDAQMTGCRESAPFAGRVAAVQAQEHGFVKEGDPVLELVSLEDLEAQALVPSAWLRWIKPGEAFSLTMDETGQTHSLVVDRLGARIDPVSQTVEVFGRFAETPKGLLPGMSGSAAFPGAPAAGE